MKIDFDFSDTSVEAINELAKDLGTQGEVVRQGLSLINWLVPEIKTDTTFLILRRGVDDLIEITFSDELERLRPPVDPPNGTWLRLREWARRGGELLRLRPAEGMTTFSEYLEREGIDPKTYQRSSPASPSSA